MNIETDKFIEARTGFQLCEQEDKPQKCENCGELTMQLYYQKTDYWSADGNFWCFKCAHGLAKEWESGANVASEPSGQP